MLCITKEVFLQAQDMELVPVPLPAAYGNDAGLFVKPMTGTERSTLEKMFMDNAPKDDPGGFRAAILVRCVCDDKRQPVFTEADKAALMKKNAGALELLFEAACKLNGFTKKDVEVLEKN